MIGIADSAGFVGHGKIPRVWFKVQFARVRHIATILDVFLSMGS